MSASRTPSETRTPRMEPLARLPVFFGLAGKRAVVAGGSTGAAWKAELLSAAGAKVEVFAPQPSDELCAIAAEQSSITINARAWRAGDLEGAAVAVGAMTDDTEAGTFAAAARAADVSGLPPTYISVGGLDLFLEENLSYADRLSRAGVPVELHMYPRAYHGFYRATNARVTRQAEHDTREALRRFLHG